MIHLVLFGIYSMISLIAFGIFVRVVREKKARIKEKIPYFQKGLPYIFVFLACVYLTGSYMILMGYQKTTSQTPSSSIIYL